MTLIINTVSPVFQAGTSDAEIEAAATQAARHRTRMVYFWRSLILVVFLGGWQLATAMKWMDVFFFSSPLRLPSAWWSG